MKNLNPIYLIEGRFLNSVKDFLSNDLRFARKRLGRGQGKRIVNRSFKQFHGDPNLIRSKAEYDLLAASMGGRITDEARQQILGDVDSYLNTMGDWKSSKTALWDETKALPGRAWKGIKDAFKGKQISLDTSNQGEILPIAAAGLGTLGFTTLANDPTVKIGYSNDKKRINPKNQRYPR